MEDNNNQDKMNTMTLEELERNIKSLIPDLQLASKPPAVHNPFKYYSTLTTADKIKLGLGCFLVPIRLLLLVLVTAFTILWAAIFLLGYKETTPPTPLTGWRKVGQKGLYFICRIVCIICGFHNVKIKGSVDPSARVLVAVPHSSHMDACIFALVGVVTGVSKAENALVPMMGNVFRLFQPTYIHRSDKNSKVAVVKEIKRKVHDPRWPPTMIAVEGTCTNRRAYTFFKPGAFYPGVPVQPFIVRFPDCENGGLDYATWTWIGPGAAKLSLIMMCRLHNRAEIEILPLYTPNQEEIDDAFTYARNVRDYVAGVDGKPTTDHSYEDCRLMKAAVQFGLPAEAGLVEYYKISPMINMNCESMIESLKKFAAIDKKKDGYIDIGEFCEYLKLPPTIEEVKTIFRIYDINKNGYIEFREYLLASFLISKPFNSEENIAQAFNLIDSAGSGHITLQGFHTLLNTAMTVEESKVRSMFDEIDTDKTGVATLEQFKHFCLNKPEYALLFIHFRNLAEKTSSMTTPVARLKRSSSLEEYESLSTVYI